MPPIISKAVGIRDMHGNLPLKSSFSVRNSPGSRIYNETPSGTPNTFYGMLTRSALLDTTMSNSSIYNTPLVSQQTNTPRINSNLYLSQGSLEHTNSPDCKRNTLTDDNLLHLLATSQQTLANVTLENKELREHIVTLSNALQNSVLLIDKKEKLIQERDTFIRELATRLLLDRQKQY